MPRSVFEYEHYRDFLRDYYTHAKSTNPKFSFRYFSRLAGFNSSCVLKHVIDGAIKIAPTSIERYVRALKLNKNEAFFFHHLVMFNQAQTSEVRQHHAEELLRSRKYKELNPMSSFQYNYLSHWYYIPVRELIGMPGFQENPEWIAKTISPPITPLEAKKALEDLVNFKMAERGPEGKLKLTSTHVSTGNEFASAALAKLHRELVSKAVESIDRHPRNKRDISTVTISVSLDTAGVIKEMVQAFRKQVLEVASKDAHPNHVYQLNFQLFPLSENLDLPEEKK